MKVPEEVAELCRQVDVALEDVAEWRVGEREVVVMDRRGRKHRGDVVRLDAYSPAAKGRGGPARGAGARKRGQPRLLSGRGEWPCGR